VNARGVAHAAVCRISLQRGGAALDSILHIESQDRAKLSIERGSRTDAAHISMMQRVPAASSGSHVSNHFDRPADGLPDSKFAAASPPRAAV